MIGFPQVRSSLYRNRRQRFPPVPNSLQEFAEILQQPQWSELGRSISEDGEGVPFFRGLIGPGGVQGWSAAVYLSARLQDALRNSRRIHMDATFKVLPLQLGTRLQLLTVHAEYLNYLFPVVFVIMTRKTQQAYEGVLRYLVQLVPQLEPEIVMADFETAIRNAARLVWPRARVVGCFFHYAQAIFRMHSTLQLRPLTAQNLEARKALGMLMALCLLPAERIQTGLRVITHYVTTHGLLQRFRLLLMYLENTWMRVIGPETFSVFGQCHRTNNALKGFYSRLVQRMGPHPGVWQFHGELRTIESAQWTDYIRISGGILHVRPIRRAYRRQNTSIFLESERLVQGTYNEAQYLDIMSHCTRGLQRRWGVEVPAAGDTRPAVPIMPPPLPFQEPTARAPAAVATIPTPAAVSAPATPSAPPPAVATIPTSAAVPAPATPSAPPPAVATIPTPAAVSAPATPSAPPSAVATIPTPAAVPAPATPSAPPPAVATIHSPAAVPALATPSAPPPAVATIPTPAAVPAPATPNEAGVPRTCAVCLTQRATHVVIPCGHLCMCTECSDTLPGYQENLQCPLCRRVSQATYKVYF